MGTFGILFNHMSDEENGSRELWAALRAYIPVAPALAAYSFMVFNLLCAPCFAAMGAIKREMNNGKWFWFAIGYQTLLAYCVSLCVYQIGLLFTTGSFGIWTAVAILLVIAFLYLLFRPYRESKKLDVKIRNVASAK